MERSEGQRDLEFQYEGDIEVYSGTSPKTKEVADLLEAFGRTGEPLMLYELLQNAVQHGRNGHMIIEYTIDPNGPIERMVFNGAIQLPETAIITGIEVHSSGPGLHPDNMITYEKGEESTLSADPRAPFTLNRYGRGLTVALTAFEALGMHATVTSNYKGQAWQATTALGPRPQGGKDSVMYAKGQWHQQESDSTVVRIENPSPALCTSLNKVADMFLYANPKYANAVVVEKDPNAPPPNEAVVIEAGKVECVEGVLEVELDKIDFLYVDGLKIRPSGYHRFILPWSVMGLAETENRSLRIARSFNSLDIEGDCKKVIGYAVAHLENRAALERIVDYAFTYPYFLYDELENLVVALSPATRAIIQIIWQEKYEGALIGKADEHADLAKNVASSSATPTKKVQLLSYSLYNFLQKAGIKTVTEELGAKLLNTEMISVPSAYAPDPLNIVVDKVAREGGEVDIVNHDGQQYLRIALLGTPDSPYQFNGVGEDAVGKLVRIIAIIAARHGIDYKIFSLTGKECRNIDIVATEGTKPVFTTKITLLTAKREGAFLYPGYDDGKTYILLSNADIKAMELTPLEKLLKLYRKIKAEVEARIKKMRQGREKRSVDGDDDLFNTPVPGHSGKLSSVVGVTEGDGFVIEPTDQTLPVGRYIRSIYQKLAFSPSGRLMWESDPMYVNVIDSIPRKKLPKPAIDHVRYKLNGPFIPAVGEGHKIAAFLTVPATANIAIYRNDHTGTYCISGKVEKLIYYTVPDFQNQIEHFRKKEPFEPEKEKLFDESRLDDFWKGTLAQIRATTGSVDEKATALQKIWGPKFAYTDQIPENLMQGRSIEEVIVNIINTCKGNCTHAATGFAALLRALDIPCHVVGMYNKNTNRSDFHMMVDYWNGTCWMRIEPQWGLQADPGSIERLQVEYQQALRGLQPKERAPSKSIITPKRVAATVAVVLATVVGSGYTVFSGEASKHPGPIHSIQDKIRSAVCK